MSQNISAEFGNYEVTRDIKDKQYNLSYWLNLNCNDLKINVHGNFSKNESTEGMTPIYLS